MIFDVPIEGGKVHQVKISTFIPNLYPGDEVTVATPITTWRFRYKAKEVRYPEGDVNQIFELLFLGKPILESTCILEKDHVDAVVKYLKDALQ